MEDTFEAWSAYAAGLVLPDAMWVDGRWKIGAGAPNAVVSPRDGCVITSVGTADQGDVDAAVGGARRTFERGTWRRMAPRDRGAVLQRWADLIATHKNELAALIALEMGKPVLEARDVEVKAAERTFRYYGELVDKQMDESPRGLESSVALVTREPVGVVAAITPWNFPLTLSSWKIAAALTAGNSVVVKPALLSPLSLLRVAELGSAAGLPDGALQVLVGTGPGAGAALSRHHDVDCLTFTGSPGVGRQLMIASGESNIKPVYLELGGKTPFIVCADAPDLEAAADAAAWAITFNAGQMCTAGSRLLVDERIATDFVATVIDKIAAKRVGDPFDPATDIGPLVGTDHRSSVLGRISVGLEEGAELLLGSDTAPGGPGAYMSPAVFADVAPESSLFQEEIFGPVLAVSRFSSIEHAVELANDSRFGLGASLWTSEVTRVHHVARALECGTVWVNCFEEGDLTVPFGGRKLSGFGSDKSAHAVEKFTHLKTTWIQL